MRLIIITALLLIAGQASASEQVISVQHDSARGVTCWILNNTGISCLPDSSLPQVNVTPSHNKNAPTPANASDTPPQIERFQL
ncbi:hypothetical protein [Pseudomonas fitomaticsae]|uniref:Uncharacterized protein n=1 Tax=Pseudomonas fitomaticsae TaxID=2837969 RepID=A0ABY3PY25_9PSED|nr:hypothetical protein [Pseudomonas fitomaticsae]UFP98582.1 hypothetical protein KJY40_21420 [Pseudomonas fitomaticsae]